MPRAGRVAPVSFGVIDKSSANGRESALRTGWRLSGWGHCSERLVWWLDEMSRLCVDIGAAVCAIAAFVWGNPLLAFSKHL